MRRYSSLDFTIKDENNMYAFFHVAWRLVYHVNDSIFMNIFRLIKIKMKMGYECWRRGCQLQELILDGIKKTLEESLAYSTAMVQKFVNSEDGVPAYSASCKWTPANANSAVFHVSNVEEGESERRRSI